MAESPILYGEYEYAKPGALESQLADYFGQRFAAPDVRVWKKRPWSPPLAVTGRARDTAFALDEGRCTFTLPARLEDAKAFRKFLESKKAKNVQLRKGTPADVSRTRDREIAIASSRPAEVVAKKRGRPVGAKPWSVTVLFDPDKSVQPANELTVIGDEVIGFNTHAAGPQLHVLRDMSERTISNLAYPISSLQGVSIGPDSALWMGGAFAVGEVDRTAIYVSTDRGQTWREEPAPGLAKLTGGKRIRSTCWFESELWVTSEKGVFRRTMNVWTAAKVSPTMMEPVTVGLSDDSPPRLVVAGDSLYLLGQGVARWDGRRFVAELAPDPRWYMLGYASLVETKAGTLFAGGTEALWRKARGKKWARVSHSALGINPDEPIAIATSSELLVAGDHLIVVANTHNPEEQVHLVRVSDDDGKTFRNLDIPTSLTSSSAVVDPRGGVLVAGFGGVLLRVTLPGGTASRDLSRP